MPSELILIGKRPDGGISVVYPSPCVGEEIAFNDEIKRKFISWRITDGSALPTSRHWRDAWCDEQEGEQIDIRMSSAKEIALSRLRAKRDKKLEELDKQTLIAIGKGDDAMRQSVESQKKALRDATEPLKNLQVSGYNDEEVLISLKQLSVLE